MPRDEARPLTPATPIWISRQTRTALIVLGLLAAVLVVYYAPTIVVLGMAGLGLAILLSVPVRLLERVMPTGLAIALALLLLIALAVLSLVFIIPVLVEQLGELVESIPTIAESVGARVPSALDWLAEHGMMPQSREQLLDRIRSQMMVGVQDFARWILGSLGQIVTGAVSVAIGLFAIVFIAVYFLADARRFKAIVVRSGPRRYRRDLLALWDAFSYTLSRYLGGLLITLTAQGVLSAIALYALGVPYALLLGAWVSITAIVPFLGALIGSVPAILIALTISPLTALLTAIAYLLIQQLEANLLTPRIQGEAVHVHPVIILLAVLGAGQLFGLLGVLFAVPVLAVLRVLLDFFRTRLRVRRDEQPKRLPPAGATTPG